MITHANNALSLPPLELECMKALWALGSASVHDIRGRMWASRPLAYTTIMTVMERLARKGAVERRREGRYYVYRALISDSELRERAVARLMDEFFLGSPEALRRYLESRTSATRAGNRISPGLVKQPITHSAKPELKEDASPRAGDHDIDPTLL